MAENSIYGRPYRPSPALYLTRMPDPVSHEPDATGNIAFKTHSGYI
jgi:hypothetical protein